MNDSNKQTKSNIDLSKTTENRALQLVKADQNSVRNDQFALKSQDFEQGQLRNQEIETKQASPCRYTKVFGLSLLSFSLVFRTLVGRPKWEDGGLAFQFPF